MNAELAKIARDMRGLERELWRGKKMGEFAMALSLGAYADRIDEALGLQPRPKTYRTPQAAIDAVTQNPPLAQKPKAESQRLHDENARAAGMRGGCLPVAVAAAAVCGLLALPGILMAVLGLVFGGGAE